MGMNIDLASIDMVSEVNMVSAALARAVPDPCPAVRAHSVHRAGPEAFSAGPSGAPGCRPPAPAAPGTRPPVRGASWARSRAEGAPFLRKGRVLGWPSTRPGATGFSSALAPGPEASRVRSASLATGAGEPGRGELWGRLRF